MINNWIAKGGIVVAVAGLLTSGTTYSSAPEQTASTLPAYDTVQAIPISDEAAEPIAHYEDVEVITEAVNENINKIILKREEKPHAGYDIHISRVEFSMDNEATVYYYLIDPAEEDFHAQVITQPEAYIYVPSEYESVKAVNAIAEIQLPAPGDPVEWPTPIGEDDAVEFPTPIEVEDGHVDFNGAVQEIAPSDQEGDLAVLKVGEVDSPAIVHITENTTFFKLVDGVEEFATLEDLAVGAEVDVTFDGPIMMIYPPVGNAGKIVIK